MVLLCESHADGLCIEDGKLLAALIAQLLVLKLGDHIDAESIAVFDSGCWRNCHCLRDDVAARQEYHDNEDKYGHGALLHLVEYQSASFWRRIASSAPHTNSLSAHVTHVSLGAKTGGASFSVSRVGGLGHASWACIWASPEGCPDCVVAQLAVSSARTAHRINLCGCIDALFC